MARDERSKVRSGTKKSAPKRVPEPKKAAAKTEPKTVSVSFAEPQAPPAPVFHDVQTREVVRVKDSAEDILAEHVARVEAENKALRQTAKRPWLSQSVLKNGVRGGAALLTLLAAFAQFFRGEIAAAVVIAMISVVIVSFKWP